MTAPPRHNPAPHPALALLIFALTNAGLQLGFYLHHLQALVSVAVEPPSTTTQIIFISFITALLSAVALTFYGLGRLEHRLTGRARVATGVTFAAEVLLLLLVGVDTLMFENLGLHLYSSFVLDALDNPEAQGALHVSTATLWSLTAYITASIAGQAALLYGCHRLTARERKTPQGLGRGALPGAAAVVLSGATTAAALTSGLTGPGYVFLEALPFFHSLSGAVTYRVPDRLAYPPAMPEIDPEAARPDLLFILVESWRDDGLNPDDMPALTAHARDLGCVRPRRHVAGGHTSEYGAFTLLYGLRSYHFEPFQRAATPAFPLELLEAAGYERLGGASSALRNWNDSAFIVDTFDAYREFLTTNTWRDDRALTDWALGALTEASPAPRFVFTFFNATHHNYLYPPEFELHTPVLPADYDHFMGDDALASHRHEIVNRYRDSLRYVDSLISELLTARADDIRSGELLVVITGDHGEEFWEHGLLGHGAPRFTAGRTAVPMLLCGLPDPPTPPELSAHVDVWPTLLDHLQFAPDLQPHHYSDGASWLRGPSPAVRFIGGLDFPWENRTAAFITREHTVWLQLCPAGPFCVHPIRLTTPDDALLPLTGADALLAPHLDAFYEHAQRFVPIEPE